jgi:hypothetical protein
LSLPRRCRAAVLYPTRQPLVLRSARARAPFQRLSYAVTLPYRYLCSTLGYFVFVARCHVALVATSLARDHVTCAYRCARRQRCHRSRFKNIAATSPSPYALTAEIPYYLYYSQVQYEARSEPISLPSYRGRTGAQERLPSRGRYGHVALAKVLQRTFLYLVVAAQGKGEGATLVMLTECVHSSWSFPSHSPWFVCPRVVPIMASAARLLRTQVRQGQG